MKSFFIRRERAKCSKKRCMDRVAWTWTLLEQNRSDRCEHEAGTHAAAGFKERDPGGREEPNKRDPYLKMCFPGGAGEGVGLEGVGTETADCQISTRRVGKRRLWLAWWG